MHLDMVTMSAVDITVTAVLGLVLVYTWLKQLSARLVGWWSLILLVQAGGLVIVAAGALSNAPVVITAGLAVMLLSDSLKWTAAREFVGRGMSSARALVAPLVFVFLSWLGALDDLADRFVMFSLLTAFVNAGAAFELALPKEERLFSYWPAVVMLAVTGVAILLVVPLALSGEVPFENPSEVYLGGWFSSISFVMVITRIALAFVVLSMAKQREEMEQRANALTDTLTGLPNRRALYEHVDVLERKRASRNAPISVLFFDLDHFKEINDTFGHQAGDAVLKTFAAIAAARLGEGHIIARMGGEEFAALLPGIDVGQAVTLAEDVRKAFAEEPRHRAADELGATVSVGVATSGAAARDTCDVGALLRQADAALYEAKRAGRNRVKVIPPGSTVNVCVDQRLARRRHGAPRHARQARVLAGA